MVRVSYGVARHRKKKRVLRRARGYWGGRSRLYRTAKESILRAGRYAYIGRKQRKRVFRRLWIVRISAAVRSRGLSYSRFMAGIAAAGIELDRKRLSEIAIQDPSGFDAIVEDVRGHLAA
jgi:large subunit ribosomal protein L20